MPPNAPAYSLRRIWLSREEEQGYYYGFSNEGLWPLCHLAHTRPVFRAADFAAYKTVNRRFANAVVEEASTRDPIVFVHEFAGDYRSWEPQVRQFARRYRCITFNARLFPISRSPPRPARVG